MLSISALLSSLQKFWFKYHKAWPFLLILVLLGISAWSASKFIWATEIRGVGVRSDSVAYLWSAENLAKGVGLGRLTGTGDFKPMTHWPPLYPIVLALFNLLGLPVLAAARWVDVALFALNVFLMGLCMARLTRSFWFSISAAAILAVAPGFWTTSLDAMTEPLYLALSLAAFLVFDIYLENNQKKWLAGAMALTAGCLLTRYIGFTLVLTFPAVILLRAGWPLVERIKKAVIFGVLSILPFLIWMGRNLIETGTATNRQMQLFPIAPEDFQLTVQTLSGWFSPNQAVLQIGLGKMAALLLVGLLFWANWKLAKGLPQSTSSSRLPLMCAIYIVIYGLGTLGSRLFFDPLITFFEQRIAFLIYPPLLLIVFYCLNLIYNQARRRSVILSAILVLMYTLTAYSYGVVYLAEDEPIFNTIRTNGLGYADITLRDPCLIETFKNMPADKRVYSDNVERLYFFTGRNSDQIVDQNLIGQIALDKNANHLIFVSFYTTRFNDLVKSNFPTVRQLCEKPVIYEVDR